MAIIEAIPVNGILEYWPKYFGGLAVGWDPLIKYFRIGEGGWEDPGTGVARRRTPSGVLTDLDCTENPTRYPTSSRYVFEKTLLGGALTYADYTLSVECFLDFAEGNSTGTADFWEIGLFSDHPLGGPGKLLVAYGTFDKDSKTVATTMTKTVRIRFGR